MKIYCVCRGQEGGELPEKGKPVTDSAALAAMQATATAQGISWSAQSHEKGLENGVVHDE